VFGATPRLQTCYLTKAEKRHQGTIGLLQTKVLTKTFGYTTVDLQLNTKVHGETKFQYEKLAKKQGNIKETEAVRLVEDAPPKLVS